MINWNLNANTTCMHDLTTYATVNCIILSKQIELFLMNSAHLSQSSHNISSHCMVTERSGFICKDGVISDPAPMDLLLTTPPRRLFTAHMVVPKYLRVISR